MNAELAASYAYCERAAARAHSNFYWSFRLLPQAKRRAMCALYAYFRAADDIVDQPGSNANKQAALCDFRGQLAGTRPRADQPLWPAFFDAVARYGIPTDYFSEVLDGVEMDLRGFRPATFAELEPYCYRVASVVGLACLHLWGFTDPAALDAGRACGIAFQLTNILRDLREDQQQGRSYLPADEVGAPDGCPLTVDEFEFQCGRIVEYYQTATAVEKHLHPDGRRIFGAMLETYAALFAAVRRAGPNPGAGKVRLSRFRKARLLAKWLFHPRPRVRLPFQD